MEVYINNQGPYMYHAGQYVQPLDSVGDVVVVIDPSKTNMACLVGTPTGEIIQIVEFTGNGRGRGTPMDTTVYCNEVITYLKDYLVNVNIYFAAIEKTILKKGMEYYHSNTVLNEIRSAVLDLYVNDWGFDPKKSQVNNYSWKSFVLPDGYRGHNEKGSKRFVRNYYPDSVLNQYFQADATDAWCIFQYVVAHFCSDYEIVCLAEEQSARFHPITIRPVTTEIPNTYRKFRFNSRYSLEANATYYSNRTSQSGYCKVLVNKLTLDDIYKYAYGFTELNFDVEEVLLVVYDTLA